MKGTVALAFQAGRLDLMQFDPPRLPKLDK